MNYVYLAIGIFIGYIAMYIIYNTPTVKLEDNLEGNIFIDENKVCYTYKKIYIN